MQLALGVPSENEWTSLIALDGVGDHEDARCSNQLVLEPNTYVSRLKVDRNRS
jgi:hypothetical protein